MRVALVIPAWNEPEAMAALLDEVPREHVDDLLVIVPSEADPTCDVARSRGRQVLVQSDRGYGAACLTGARAAIRAGAEVLAFLDGDYSDPPGELPRLLEPISAGEADLVLGCRDLRRFPAALPAHARLGNAMVRLLLRALVRRHYSDLPSFKVITVRVFERLRMREMTYGWTVEMLVKAARTGIRVREVPVSYRPRLGGASKVGGSLSGSMAAGCKLLACAVTYSTGRHWSTVGGQ